MGRVRLSLDQGGRRLVIVDLSVFIVFFVGGVIKAHGAGYLIQRLVHGL